MDVVRNKLAQFRHKSQRDRRFAGLPELRRLVPAYKVCTNRQEIVHPLACRNRAGLFRPTINDNSTMAA